MGAVFLCWGKSVGADSSSAHRKTHGWAKTRDDVGIVPYGGISVLLDYDNKKSPNFFLSIGDNPGTKASLV